MSTMIGPLLVVFFALSQAFRDVYFGSIFQHFDFFAIILLAFSLSTAIFAVMTLIRAPGEFKKLRGQGGTIVAANIFTTAAWSSFFFALTYLDPSIVNTIHSAMGPLTVVVLGAFGISLAKPGHVGRWEYVGYAGIALSVVALWGVVIGGYSGLPVKNYAASVAGLALLTVSGASITVSLLYCKRLQDNGIGADTVTAVRYWGLIALAAGMTIWSGRFGGIKTVSELATLSVASTALIILPLYAFQVGIGRTSPLTANVIRALGPVFVFALEQFDGRIHYSIPVLVCILAYSAFVILSNVAHGWREDKKPPAPLESARLAVATPATWN
jgi:drug/metabolite transporter (DMT)-like permease